MILGKVKPMKTENKNEKHEMPTDYFVDINGVSVNIEYKNAEDSYAMRKRILTFFKALKAQKYRSEDVKKLYNKAFDFLLSDFTHLQESMDEDLRELDICFTAGAYKATLVLAGSILEAFLLDWLSEIDGKNYFEEPYMVQVKRGNEVYYEKKEELYEYIKQIKYIERPNWMESSEKAHYIRKKRNIVHAKVCLKEDVEINEDTCRKVIGYLTEIINTRLEKRKKELEQ